MEVGKQCSGAGQEHHACHDKHGDQTPKMPAASDQVQAASLELTLRPGQRRILGHETSTPGLCGAQHPAWLPAPNAAQHSGGNGRSRE
ncbi:MAG: hypothetical protein JWO42_3420 [Chloroflexi bacterium]|jgi:hypothetical protein|nr:hypothetical protein [Chloroflexota bacterium]